MKKIDVSHSGIDGFDVAPSTRVKKTTDGVAMTSPGQEDIGVGMDTQGMGPGADIAMNEKKSRIKRPESFHMSEHGLPKGFTRWHTHQGRDYKHPLDKAKGHFTDHNLGKHEMCFKNNLTCSEIVTKTEEKQEPEYGGKLEKEHIGFKALENKLAHKPGITNPAAVTASIGRKKMGKGEETTEQKDNRLQREANVNTPGYHEGNNWYPKGHSKYKETKKLSKEEWLDVAHEGDEAERLANFPGDTAATKVPASVDNPKAKKLKQGVEPKRMASANDQMTPQMESEVKKNAFIGYGAPSARSAAMPNLTGSPAMAKKVEPLSKPPVSQAQREAMGAAAHGKSTLGIPKDVGQHFMNKDPGGKLPARKSDNITPNIPVGGTGRMLHQSKKAEVPMAKPPTGTASKPTAAPKMAIKQPSLGKTQPGVNEEGVPNKFSKEFEKGEGMGMTGGAAVPGMSSGQEPAVNNKAELEKGRFDKLAAGALLAGSLMTAGAVKPALNHADKQIHQKIKLPGHHLPPGTQKAEPVEKGAFNKLAAGALAAGSLLTGAMVKPQMEHFAPQGQHQQVKLPGHHLAPKTMAKSGMPWGGAGIKAGSGTPAGVVKGGMHPDAKLMANKDAHMAHMSQASAPAPKVKLPSPAEDASRAQMYSDFMPKSPPPKLPGLTPPKGMPKMGKGEESMNKAHPSEMEMDEQYSDAGDPNQEHLSALHDSTVDAKPGLGLAGHSVMSKGYDPKVYLPVVRAAAEHGMTPQDLAEFAHSKAGRFAGDALSGMMGHPDAHKAVGQHIKVWQKWKAKQPK